MFDVTTRRGNGVHQSQRLFFKAWNQYIDLALTSKNGAAIDRGTASILLPTSRATPAPLPFSFIVIINIADKVRSLLNNSNNLSPFSALSTFV